MRIIVAADHAGYSLKELVVATLRDRGHDVEDAGTDSEAPVDYPPFCVAVAEAVIGGTAELGVLVGGTGSGEAVVANKVSGARAAVCGNEYTARIARAHLDANVLVLGARVLGSALALAILDVFTETAYEGGRHEPRLASIRDIERRLGRSGS